MSDEPRFLAPGPLPLAGPDFGITAPLGRVGDGLVYAGRDGPREARLREYAPARIVRREADGTLRPADERFAAAWEDASSHFLQQGHRLAAFDHPGVAPVWRAVALNAHGIRQGAYLIGAPVGQSLAAALQAGLQLSPRRVMAIAAALADVLAALHARGLCHLDIGPDTLTISAGRLQLTDFAVDNRSFMALLETQAGLVRPGYSPIEHHDASMADPLGPRADIYSASALLYRLVTGRDPASWQERWRDPAAARLPDQPDFPPAFIAAVRQGMAIEPDDRFPDGAAWRDALALPAPEPEPLVETIIIRRDGDARTVIAPALEVASPPIAPAQTPPPPPPPAPPPPAPTPPPPAPPPPPHVAPAAEQPAGWMGAAAPPVRAAAPSGSAPPFAPAPAAPPDAARRPNRLLPLLLALALLVIAAGAYFAYTQRWFAPAGNDRAQDNSAAPRAPSADRPRTRAAADAPVIEVGATVSGQLAASDTRRGGGQFEDRFTLEGRQGERVELRLSSTDFDPLLTVTGNGLDAANDDDEARGTRNSRLALTLPRAGRYTIGITSYRRGGTGSYLLEVQPARPAVSIAVPAMLAGRWRVVDDEECSVPAQITVEGRELVIRYAGGETRQQILDGVGRTIRTRPATAEGDQDARYLISDDGDGFQLNGRRWVRC